ncbi:LysR family transcriptional regulator [Algicella marina]|uniref:LysR family transcriptional regulator n=1 Tax=Algicella marina TaxID=2683284 RepID=A0A6P1SYF6_9RHOB|nr:LysR family transcriptional regulator [Algicella marina]QHQ34246.1 LysR family transcriptional regulator [Algicella marina]
MLDQRLHKGLKISHIRLLAAVLQEENLSAAAMRVGISQPAASRLAGELDALLGCPLYLRTARGVRLTAEGAALAKRAARMLSEIDLAGREIEELRSGAVGRVRVGSVTGPAVEYVLPAIAAFRLSHGQVAVGVDVGTSDDLMPRLLDGTLDFALARRPAHLPSEEFVELPLIDEPVDFIVRAGHPLLGQGRLPVEAALAYEWVLPFERALLRETVERALRAEGLAMPATVLSTSSFLATLAAVRNSNAVAPIASSVADGFPGSEIRTLPLTMQVQVERYSYFQRAGTDLTPAARALARDVIGRLQPALLSQMPR